MSIDMLNQRVPRLALLTVSVSLGLTGCFGDDDGDKFTSQSTYSADIQRTEFGIPHITANDYKGLGYGVGYW